MSFWVYIVDNSDTALHTQLWIDPSEEFLQYTHNGDPVDVTFGVKELKVKLFMFCNCYLLLFTIREYKTMITLRGKFIIFLGHQNLELIPIITLEMSLRKRDSNSIFNVVVTNNFVRLKVDHSTFSMSMVLMVWNV